MTTTTQPQPAATAKLDGPDIDIASATPESVVGLYVAHAVGVGASDLFFASHPAHIGVQMRHLGILRLIGALPLELGRRALAHIKAGAGIDTAEKRRPLDGRWKLDLTASGRPVKARRRRHRRGCPAHRPSHQFHPHPVRRRCRPAPAPPGRSPRRAGITGHDR